MNEFTLDVRMDEYADPIGLLKQNSDGVMSFEYVKGYDAKPLCENLNYRNGKTVFSHNDCFEFFKPLLPFTAERLIEMGDIMHKHGIKKDDMGKSLYYMGNSCLGAISVLPHGSPPTRIHGNFKRDYEEIKMEELIKISEFFQNCEPLPKKFNQSSYLGGFHNKIALVALPDDTFAIPVKGSGAPTTHILKFSDQNLPNQTVLEELVMKLSKKFGIKTAEVIGMKIGETNALLVTRYDRKINKNGDVIRIHQQDLAETIGLELDVVHEWKVGNYPEYNAKAIAAIIKYSSNPIEMREYFINATVFDLMIGNNDGHAKNFSLMYSDKGELDFAPRYDIVPRSFLNRKWDKFVYPIGNATTLEEITVDNFNMFLADLEIESPSEQKRMYDRTVLDLGNKFANELDDLDKDFADFVAGNINTLFCGLGLEIPDLVHHQLNPGLGWKK